MEELILQSGIAIVSFKRTDADLGLEEGAAATLLGRG